MKTRKSIHFCGSHAKQRHKLNKVTQHALSRAIESPSRKNKPGSVHTHEPITSYNSSCHPHPSPHVGCKKGPYLSPMDNGYPSSTPHMFKPSKQMHVTIDPQSNRVENKNTEDEDEDQANKHHIGK